MTPEEAEGAARKLRRATVDSTSPEIKIVGFVSPKKNALSDLKGSIRMCRRFFDESDRSLRAEGNSGANKTTIVRTMAYRNFVVKLAEHVDDLKVDS